MAVPIRVLIIDDNPADVGRLLHELRSGGYDPLYRQVSNAEALSEALATGNWDVAISAYALSSGFEGFNGMTALQILKESGHDIPFILVSRLISEQTAAAAMRAGAHDYLKKDNLARLIPVIEREIKEADIRNEHKRAKETLLHLTYHDPLTELLNRREFERRVASAMESIRLKNDRHILCFLDLDQFKIINDTRGHIAGDELLKQLALHLRGRFSERVNIARLGGDEFGVLAKHCARKELESFPRKLQRAIREFEFVWQGETFGVSASIGVAMIDAGTQTLAKLMSAADAACHVAKELGRNQIYYYNENDKTLSRRYHEMRMVSRITRALQENRFALYRQTIMPINSAGTGHHEILLRMITEDGEVILPDAFLPAAERYNLMATIDRWVIDKVFATQGLRPDLNRDECFSSINLSGATLGDTTLLDFIGAKAREYRIPPQSICFEITETTAISNLPAATRFIRELKQLGYRFALDDFGSGLSSFMYLKNLPVDFLKIDGSFVKEICTDTIDLALVEAINHIGHVMGIKTIAEFVENREILDKLATLGVDHAQGFGIDRPRPVLDFRDQRTEQTPGRLG